MSVAVESAETAAAGETEALGAAIARRLEPGAVVLVSGELGAGKSTLVRGACRELGVTDPVTSPTFTIGRRYRTEAGGFVSHLDLYRLAGLGAEDPGLLDDYLTPDAIAFIEWPDVAESQLATRVTARVQITHAGGDRRTVEVVWTSDSGP